MDALIEIAQNSIIETSTAEPYDQSKGDAAPDKPYMGFSSEIPASDSHQEMNIDSPLSEQDLEGRLFYIIDSDQHDSEHTITDGSVEGADDPMEVVDIKDSCMNTAELSATEKNGDAILNCTSASEQPNAIEHSANKNSEQAVDFGSSIDHEPSQSNDTLIESVCQAYEGNELQIGISDSSVPLVQPLVCFPTSTAILDKVLSSITAIFCFFLVSRYTDTTESHSNFFLQN
ncbi:hypothetical protein ACFX13_035060 [Malus domestica]